MALEYKFVELSIVTDESIEEAVNAWTARGWLLEGIRFVTTEASRRPSMAFISFTRERVGEPGMERGGFTPTRGEEAPDEAVDKTMPRLKGPRLVKDDDE